MKNELNYIKAYLQAQENVKAAVKSMKFDMQNLDPQNLNTTKLFVLLKSLIFTTEVLKDSLSAITNDLSADFNGLDFSN